MSPSTCGPRGPVGPVLSEERKDLSPEGAKDSTRVRKSHSAVLSCLPAEGPRSSERCKERVPLSLPSLFFLARPSAGRRVCPLSVGTGVLATEASSSRDVEAQTRRRRAPGHLTHHVPSPPYRTDCLPPGAVTVSPCLVPPSRSSSTSLGSAPGA